MVRENRIKEVRIDNKIFSATTTSAIAFDDNSSINGEILEVQWNFARAGSMWLTVSGNGQQVWRNNAPSGASNQWAVPARIETSATGSIAGPFQTTPFIANAPLILNVGSALSGTTALNMVVRYR